MLNNKNLEDNGWKQMAALLDTEMPVNKKERKPIWWWLAGTGVLLLAIALWHGQTEKPAATHSTAPSKTITTKSPQAFSPGKANSDKALASVPAGKTDNSNTAYRPATTLPPSTWQMEEEVPAPVAVQAPAIIFEKSAGAKTISEVKPVAGRQIATPELLDLTGIKVHSAAGDLSKTISAQGIGKPSKLWQWTTEASLAGISQDWHRPNGIHAGISKTLHSEKSRWQFNMGAAYRYQDAFYLNYKNGNAGALATNIEMGGLYHDSIRLNAVFSDLNFNKNNVLADKSLHRLQIPIRAAYSPVPKWYIETGFALTVLLNSNSLNNSLQSGPLQLDNPTVVATPGTGNILLRSWNVRWSAGIGFQCLPQWCVFAQYEQDIPDNLRANSYFTFKNKNLIMGVRYRFGY